MSRVRNDIEPNKPHVMSVRNDIGPDKPDVHNVCNATGPEKPMVDDVMRPMVHGCDHTQWYGSQQG